MKRSVIAGLVMIAVLGLTVAQASAAADDSVGTVKSFKGTARILSGDTIVDITKVGQEIKSNDRIQTEQGNVEVKFKDGAQLKVDPFSVVGVSERVEKKGIFFKSKQDTRRVTANVGTAYFSSGKGSKKKNYLQTPTAVCGLRGSIASWGLGFINQTEGTHKKKGSIKNGKPPLSTARSAGDSPVFRALKRASDAQKKSGGVTSSLAKRAALRAQQQAASSMQKNPESIVKKASKAEAMVAGAGI